MSVTNYDLVSRELGTGQQALGHRNAAVIGCYSNGMSPAELPCNWY
ncbi:MAG: hypothetical protein MZV63_56075 [Marinilabiliales bacterium]|nr:hypothetical protein [Marinilabiliales bacterium]